MSGHITRRQALKAGAGSAGLLANTAGLHAAHAWPPGPGEKTGRDLTPGPTPIRLGAYITRSRNITLEELLRENKTTSLTKIVKQLKDSGTTGLFARP